MTPTRFRFRWAVSLVFWTFPKMFDILIPSFSSPTSSVLRPASPPATSELSSKSKQHLICHCVFVLGYRAPSTRLGHFPFRNVSKSERLGDPTRRRHFALLHSSVCRLRAPAFTQWTPTETVTAVATSPACLQPLVCLLASLVDKKKRRSEGSVSAALHS